MHNHTSRVSRREVIVGAAAAIIGAAARANIKEPVMADVILHNGRITTLDPMRPEVQAVAIRDGRIARVWAKEDVLASRGATTTIIDLKGHRAIPGLNDSHIHPIRGGLNYNMEP